MTDKTILIAREHALPGREQPILKSGKHFVNQSDLTAASHGEQQQILLGMGCFWGAERLFWQQAGIISTSVGYSGGYTPNPTYEEVCSGRTGHCEVVRVIFNPRQLPLSRLLALFWENHDPTQGMRQGNDLGTQYRSAVYTFSPEQLQQVQASKQACQRQLDTGGLGLVTTELAMAGQYYLAEEYHQQYLAKNPDGYCGLGGTGICMPPE